MEAQKLISWGIKVDQQWPNSRPKETQKSINRGMKVDQQGPNSRPKETQKSFNRVPDLVSKSPAEQNKTEPTSLKNIFSKNYNPIREGGLQLISYAKYNMYFFKQYNGDNIVCPEAGIYYSVYLKLAQR